MTRTYLFKDLFTYLSEKSLSINTTLSHDHLLSGIASINNSTKSDITFFNDYKLKNDLINTKAKACFIEISNINLLPSSTIPIIVNDPYLAFAFSTNFFSKNFNKIDNINLEKHHFKNFTYGQFIAIKSDTFIDNNVTLFDHIILGPNVKIGKNTIIQSGCIISNSIIGDNCLIQSGSIIGDSGFGFTPKSKITIHHVGNVCIGNNVHIGSNTTIDRAALDSTIIKNNVRIDNLVQIAHGVSIGQNTIIAAQSGIAGSTIIGDNCIIGGQAGISGHLNIGNNVTIAAKSGVTKNLKNNSVVAGFPALDIRKWKKMIIKQYKDLK